MQIVPLLNYGVLKSKINLTLYDSLLKECLDLNNKKELISNLTKDNVAKHYYLKNINIEKLHHFINDMLIEYDKIYPNYLKNFSIINTPLPLVHGKVWINYQKKGEYLPLHEHDGIFSYSLWMKLPVESEFHFNYNSIIGRSLTHKFILNKEEEGSIILFPSLLRHVVYPFNNSDETRISISGNIEFNGNK
jgi:hypothetical protein